MRRASRVLVPFCLIFVLHAGLCAAQDKHKAGPTQAHPAALSPQELFNRVSPSVFVVESLNDSGQPAEQGSAVVIRVKKLGPIAARFSHSNEETPSKKGGTSDEWRVVSVTPIKRDPSKKSDEPPKGFGPDSPSETFLVTNYHVVREGKNFRVLQGSKTWPAYVVAVDAGHDLAELRVDGLKAPAVVIRRSSTLAVGEQVYAIGAPEGLELTISHGLVSGLRNFDGEITIQTSAAISPGSSGGGLFDSHGRLIGITTAFLKEGENLNFATPAELSLSLAPSDTGHSAPTDPALDADLDMYLGTGMLERGIDKEDDKALTPSERQSVAKMFFQFGAENLQDAVQLEPTNEDAWFALALAYFELGQYEKAVDAAEQATKLKPDDEKVWLWAGQIPYMLLGKYDKAVSAEQQAIALKPNNEVAWRSLGQAYYQLQKYEEEASAERQAISLKPDDNSAWASLGQALLGLEQDDAAATAERKALSLNLKNADAWTLLGAAYDNLRLYNEAANAEQSAIAIDPTDATAWLNLGIAYWGLGNRSQVIAVYQKLKTLDQQQATDFFNRFVLPN
jgi:S1-C subfamily serine protease/Flp pilus assembly protein TadD